MHGLVLIILVPALADSAPMPAAGVAADIAVATGVGVLSYWLLERPLLGRMRGRCWRARLAPVQGGHRWRHIAGFAEA